MKNFMKSSSHHVTPNSLADWIIDCFVTWIKTFLKASAEMVKKHYKLDVRNLPAFV